MAACLLSYPNEYSFCYCNAYAVCLSERTNDGERSGPLVVRWSFVGRPASRSSAAGCKIAPPGSAPWDMPRYCRLIWGCSLSFFRTNEFFPRLDQALAHRRRALSRRSPRSFAGKLPTRPRVGGGSEKSGQRGGYGMVTSPPGWCGGLGYLDAREIYVARGQWTRRLVEPGGSLNTQPV